MKFVYYALGIYYKHLIEKKKVTFKIKLNYNFSILTYFYLT